VRAPNTLLAIYQSQEGAEKLIEASPLRVEVGEGGVRELPRDDGGVGVGAEPAEEVDDASSAEKKDAAGHPITTTTGSHHPTRKPPTNSFFSPTATTTTIPTPPRLLPHHPHELHLRITPSIQNHAAYIKRQHYYSHFEPQKSSIAFQDLRDRVPVAGMADCEIGRKEVPLRMRKKRAEREEGGRGWVGLRDLVAKREGKGAREEELEVQ